MDIKIIIDNNTLDKALIAESGFSAYITEGKTKILFDTGEEGNVLDNAKKMGIDLLDLDFIVFSHGHHDHTNGLYDLLNIYKKENISKAKRPKIIAHPDAFYPKSKLLHNIGSKLTKKEIEDNFDVIYSKEPKWITDKLLFLGEIPRTNEFESKKPIGEVNKNNKKTDDYILDDTALAYKSDKGLVIISGCSHSGICNILDYAIKVTKENKIYSIIGGLHLKHSDDSTINKTVEKLKRYNIKKLHACHCTGDNAIKKIKSELPQENIGCGFEKSY